MREIPLSQLYFSQVGLKICVCPFRNPNFVTIPWILFCAQELGNDPKHRGKGAEEH